MGSIFSEFVLSERVGEDGGEDVYLIGFESTGGSSRLYSKFVSREDRRLRYSSYYPLSLTELEALPLSYAGFHSFYRHMDTGLVVALREVGLDSLAAYSIVHNNPELSWLLQRPIVLLVASEKISRFVALYRPENSHYKHWIPELLGVDKLTRGMIRCLSKIDVSSASVTLRAVKYLMSEYTMVLPFIALDIRINPESVLLLKQMLGERPELRFSCWLRLSDLRCTDDIRRIMRLYLDTIRLLRRSGHRHPVRHLLKIPKFLIEVYQIHDRYSRLLSGLSDRQFPDETRFFCHNLPDFGQFSVLRTAGELYQAAESLSNCAAVYDRSSLNGELVHLIYGESTSCPALLQIRFDPSCISAVEFAGVANQSVCENAWDELGRYKAFMKANMNVDLDVSGLDPIKIECGK